MHVTPSIFLSRVLRNEALGYKSYFFGTAILRKLFEIRFSYKHCNFARVCLLGKMASKTVTRSIIRLKIEGETVNTSETVYKKIGGIKLKFSWELICPV